MGRVRNDEEFRKFLENLAVRFKFCAARIALAGRGEEGRKVRGWERIVHSKAKE